jgi:O-antigen/teichoic acid export membrane protein
MLLQRFLNTLARRHNIRAHFWQTCANYTQQFSGLLLSILLARLLTPEDFGAFAYVGAVLALFLLPASWSLSPQIVSEIRSHPEIVTDALYYSRMFLIPRLGLALSACVLLAWANGWQQGAIGLFCLLPLVGGDFVAVMRATLEGQGLFKANFFDSLLTAASVALISIPAALLGAGVWALVIPAIPLFVGQIILYSRMSRVHIRQTNPLTTRSYFRSGTALWLCGCGESALLRADKFLLGQATGMGAVGDYNRAYNFSPMAARALNSLLTNASVASLTRASSNAAQRVVLAKSAILLLMAGCANFVLWWFFSDPLVPLLFGPQWSSAIPVFEAMAPLSLAISAAYLPTTFAMARRAYYVLAATRIVTLAFFMVTALMMRGQMSAVLMAWLLQGTFLLQGILLCLLLAIRARGFSKNS